MADEKEKAVSIGTLWEKNSPKGTKYFSGQVEIDGEKIRIVVFKNGYKKEDKHPDWKIFVSKPKDSDQQYQDQKQLPAHQEENEPRPSNEDDDLPF